MDTPSPSPVKKPWLMPVLLAVIALLVAGNAGTIYYFSMVKGVSPAPEKAAAVTPQPEIPPVSNVPVGTTAIEPLKADEFSVRWTDWPEKLNGGMTTLVGDSTALGAGLAKNEEFKNSLSGKVDWNDGNARQGAISDFLNLHRTYRVGQVTGGKFAGGVLYRILSDYCPEMCITDRYLVVILDGKMTLLSAYSDEPYYNAEKLLFPDADGATRIQGGVLPSETLAVPGSKLSLHQVAEREQMLIDVTGAKPMFTAADGLKVYRGNGCFLVAAKDGLVVDYKWKPDFFPADMETPFGVLAATWSDGSVNKDEYDVGTSMGCGRYCHAFVDYITDAATQIVVIGKTSGGEDLYGLKEDIWPEPKGYGPVLVSMYESFYPGYDSTTKKEKAKPSFEEFLAMRPLVFWKDPLGNWLSFSRADIAPAAECGKPVIYLYPEKTTDVSVKVEPTGGLSLSEPAYDNGWKVQASPDGSLKNLADGKAYPYLFWEGFGLKYDRPGEGFVVPREKVGTFLRRALAEQGLISKEYEEFIAFWLPKLQEKPYYFITFVPQPQFEKLAPLAVSPAPQTVIRVFMDYEGLDSPVSVRPQKLTAPARDGFTVVEWGGALHR